MSTQATLIERAKRGDHESFAKLIEPYTNRAFRVALVLVDNEADASDIVQGASLRALQSIRSLRDLGAFEAWFLRIVGNLCRDLLRQRRRHREMQLPESRVENIPEENDHIQRIVEAVDLGAALGTLSPGHRKVILLKYAEGLTSAEIAAVMDRAPGTVRRLLSEAYNQLRLVLGEA